LELAGQKGEGLVVCMRNTGYEVSLETGKVYVVLPDPKARRYGRLRVIDDSGEDYLFPSDYFLPVEMSKPAATLVAAA
jgi:hypothetical protein